MEADVYVSGTQVLKLKLRNASPKEFDDFLISFKNIKMYGEIHKTKQDCIDALKDRYPMEDIIGDNFIRVKLDQEDTIGLTPGTTLKVQIKLFKEKFKDIIITDVEDTIRVKEAINVDKHI